MGSDQNTLKVMAGLAYTLLVRSDRRTGGSSKNSLQRKNQADPQKDPKRSAGEQQVEPPPISCSLGPGPTQLHRAMGDFPDLMICVMFYIQPNRGLPLHPLLTRPNVLISFFQQPSFFFPASYLSGSRRKERSKDL